MLEEIVRSLWAIAILVFKLELPIGEYKITLLQFFIFGAVVTLVLKLCFNWGR